MIEPSKTYKGKEFWVIPELGNMNCRGCLFRSKGDASTCPINEIHCGINHTIAVNREGYENYITNRTLERLEGKHNG